MVMLEKYGDSCEWDKTEASLKVIICYLDDQR